jgi:putative ABC transport system permease protein
MMVLVVGVLPGLLPALQATRRNLVLSMRVGGSGEGRRSRAGSLFVAAQIAGSTLFLATALLFVRSFWNANAVDLGFRTDHLVIAQMAPSLYGFDGARAESLARQLAERVAAAPGMTVAVADRVPYAVGYPRAEMVSTARVDCAATPCKPVVYYAVGAHHFEALGLPLRAGRDFTEQELATGTAVVVNETLAAQLWPGQNAIGQSVALGKERRHAEVVGVARDTSMGYTGQPATPLFYRPIRATSTPSAMRLTRSRRPCRWHRSRR